MGYRHSPRVSWVVSSQDRVSTLDPKQHWYLKTERRPCSRIQRDFYLRLKELRTARPSIPAFAVDRRRLQPQHPPLQKLPPLQKFPPRHRIHDLSTHLQFSSLIPAMLRATFLMGNMRTPQSFL